MGGISVAAVASAMASTKVAVAVEGWNSPGVSVSCSCCSASRITGHSASAARRGLHALALAHQELVAQGLAQASQGVAHGRLGDGQLVGRPRQAALCHHLVEDAQQVQIQCAEVQGRHGDGR